MKRKDMYIRLCAGLQDKGKLIPLKDNIYKHTSNPTKDYYTSVYQYTEEQKQQFDEKGTIAGITDVSTNQLIFDIDYKSDLEKARKYTVTMIERLNKIGISTTDINIYFSGSKGFHVVLDTDQTYTPKEHKAIAKEIGGDLPGFDSTVYNSNRILRLAYTKHDKTIYYKTPLEYEELTDMSIDEIKGIAETRYTPLAPKQVHISPKLASRMVPSPEPVPVIRMVPLKCSPYSRSTLSTLHNMSTCFIYHMHQCYRSSTLTTCSSNFGTCLSKFTVVYTNTTTTH